MTYAFTLDVPIDAGFYERIVAALGDEPPPGLIVHVAVERPEGGLRYYDVWDAQADWDRFGEERLHPVVHEMLGETFGDDLPDEPARVPLPVIHVWAPGYVDPSRISTSPPSTPSISSLTGGPRGR